MEKKMMTFCLLIAVLFAVIESADATIVNFSDPSGLSATADFTLMAPNQLQIVLTNTSTGVPAGFNNAGQLLTGISFDLEGLTITGGSVAIGPDADDKSVNFDNVVTQLENGDDVSSEWGYGNMGHPNMLINMVSTIAASQMNPFASGPNLDGPDSLNGPECGLIPNSPILDLGGLGAIQNSILITLNLSGDLSDLSFLENGAVVEFGSDAAFVPEPATVLLLCGGMTSILLKRKRAN